MTKHFTKYLWRDAFLCSLFTLFITGIFYVFFVNVAMLDPFEKAFEDFSLSDLYTAEDFKELKPTKDIILVNIKHANRYEIAKAIEKIEEQGPKAIGVDVIFKERKDVFQDSVLRESLRKSKNLVMSYYFEEDKLVKNNNYFSTKNLTEGFINLNFDESSSVIRDFIGVKNLNDSTYISFGTQLAQKAGYLEKNNTNSYLEDKLQINYTGKASSFLTFDIEEILANEKTPALKNAIVILGYLGTPTGNPYDIEDKLFTPLNPKFVGKSVPDMYGVIIHANIVKMMINKDFMIRIPNIISYILAFLCCFFMTVLGLKIDKKNSFVFHILIRSLQLTVSIILLFVTLLLLKENIHINITPVIVLTLLGIEMIVYYGHIFHYLKKKFGWKNYLLN